MSGRYWDHRTCRWEGGADPAGPPPVWLRSRPDDLEAAVDLDAAVPAQPTAEQADPAPVVAERGVPAPA